MELTNTSARNESHSTEIKVTPTKQIPLHNSNDWAVLQGLQKSQKRHIARGFLEIQSLNSNIAWNIIQLSNSELEIMLELTKTSFNF